MLTDKGLAVQGNRATANISTRTNLSASTTDTTINFVIAEDPSAPYIDHHGARAVLLAVAQRRRAARPRIRRA